jgi:hypothetical protein
MKLKTWDGNNINDGTNYDAILDAGTYGLPAISPVLGIRQGYWPTISGMKRLGKIINFDIYIRNTPIATYQKQLAQWFDPDDETPKKLVGEDAGGGNDRYVEGICVELAEVPFSAGLHFVVSIQVDEDVMWREVTASTVSSWNITATGQTKNISNGGEMDAYPKFTFTPTSAKTGSWLYKRFIAVKWRGARWARNWPVDITNDGLDTDALETAGKIQSDLDDLRVWVDGAEVDRWCDPATDNATTKVWVNIVWEPDIQMSLKTGIGAADTTIYVDESIDDMPNSGTLMIDNEVITYDSKNNADKTFNNCSRGAKGTTAASHSAAVTVYWLQHDIWILYGNSGASAPSIDDDYKPMFRLDTSTNLSWDYDEMWSESTPERNAPLGWWNYPDLYTGTQDTTADPATVIGYHLYEEASISWGGFFNSPIDISAANFQTGYKKASSSVPGLWNWEIYSNIEHTLYEIPAPTAWNTWQSWSRNETGLAANTSTIGIYHTFLSIGGGQETFCEFGDVTFTFDSSMTPVIVIGGEQTNYTIDGTLTNNTTGEAVEIQLAGMGLNEDLEFDTDAKTMIYKEDETNQFQALTLVGGARRDWLKAQPGTNTFQWDETGVNGMTVDIEWEERFYQ